MTRTVTRRGPSATPAGNGIAQSVPSAFELVLDRLVSESSTYYGAADVRFERVSYQDRPFSHLLKVAVFTRATLTPETHLFVKIFKTARTAEDIQRISLRVARDFDKTREIYRAMSRWPDLGVVRPVACFPEHLAAVTEEAPGQTLLEYLQSHAAWLGGNQTRNEPDATMERIGRWIRAFQTVESSRGQVSVDSLRSYVDLRLARLTALPAASFTSGDRARVLAHIDRLGAAADPMDMEEVPIHADLAAGNILVSDGRVTVLDFAMARTGSRLHDLSRLCLQIELMTLKPQFRGAVLQQANRSLLHGFDPGLDRQRPMFRLLSMLHRVNHLATLSTSPGSFPVSAYNWHIRRQHRAWIEGEIRRSERGA